MELYQKKKKKISEGWCVTECLVCQCWPIREVRIGKQMEGRPLATVNRTMPLLLPNLPFSKIKKKHRWSDQQMARSHFTTSNRKKKRKDSTYSNENTCKLKWAVCESKRPQSADGHHSVWGTSSANENDPSVHYRSADRLTCYVCTWQSEQWEALVGAVWVWSNWTRDNVSTFRDGWRGGLMMEIRRCCWVDLHIYTVATSSAVEKEIIIIKKNRDNT